MLCLSQYTMCVYACELRTDSRKTGAHFFPVSYDLETPCFCTLDYVRNPATRVSTRSFVLQGSHPITLQTSRRVPPRTECNCAHSVEDMIYFEFKSRSLPLNYNTVCVTRTTILTTGTTYM